MDAAMEFLANDVAVGDCVRGCFSAPETPEFQWAFPLYQLCVACFPNALAIKLLGVYLGQNSDLKTPAIQLLAFHLSVYSFPAYVLNDLKPLLLACLREQTKRDQLEREADAKFLRIIAYSITSIASLESKVWPELGDCIRDLANSEALMGFSVFIDLPPVLRLEFMSKFYRELLDEARKSLTITENRGSQELITAFDTMFLIGIQLSGEMHRIDLTPEVIELISTATEHLISEGRSHIIEEAAEELKTILERNKDLYRYLANHREFIFKVVYRMLPIGLPISTQILIVQIIEVGF